MPEWFLAFDNEYEKIKGLILWTFMEDRQKVV